MKLLEERLMIDDLESFESFVTVNMADGQAVNSHDYLYMLYKDKKLPNDFVLHFAKLFWPNFTVLENFVFCEDLFKPDYYERLMEESSLPHEIQYWMNLLEITALFDGLSSEEAMNIAEIMVRCWNAKLDFKLRQSVWRARAIYDQQYDEVYITIDQKKSKGKLEAPPL